ncbi:hypothetical protein [Brevundimonas sp. Root1423]|uniref:hypothetical protein n=1 Tax=Brevundimonas sp. Root1423 TaxID=1736462 RepID=UPI0006F523DA|nr:hypothetical protein [Brevundimonas sp. Root1423]KQY84757.1 hypothetical protein ASD25_06970 [Brevundimonas sp. Root1423]
MSPLVRLACLAGLLSTIGGPALATPPQDAAAAEPKTLVELMTAGREFLVATKKDSVPLRPGDWSYPEGFDRWVVFEGRYTAESGIWSSDGLGFRVRNNEYHGCPPNLDRSRFICGGAHSDGYRMSAPITPSDHVVVILGNELPFDDDGNVYRDGQLIGVITVPPAP